MRVLITGSAGMLARDLVPCLAQAGHVSFAPPEPDLDILNLGNIRAVAAACHPNIIINCAAYTRVDQAETEEHLAAEINGLAVQNLCLVCQDNDIPLVHFSTDYVFDGAKQGPYTIYDEPDPINAYGRSKYLGERYVTWLLRRFYLVRSSWLFGAGGDNFVETMLGLATKQKQVSVVNDQRGCPTSARDLSEAVAALIESGRYGIYHITNSEPTTWFDYAREIFRLSGTGTTVLPIASDQFPAAARRPRNCVLDSFPLSHVIGREMRSWKQALDEYLRLRQGKVCS